MPEGCGVFENIIAILQNNACVAFQTLKLQFMPQAKLPPKNLKPIIGLL